MWMQGTNDTFDWALHSGGTPTSNTGPSAGSAGARVQVHTSSWRPTIKLRARMQPSRAAILAAASLLTTTCTVEASDSSRLAARMPPMARVLCGHLFGPWGGGQGNSWQATTVYSASSSYYRITATRGPGIRDDIAIDNLNLLACTTAPTSAPTAPTQDFDAHLLPGSYPSEVSWHVGEEGTTYGHSASHQTISLPPGGEHSVHDRQLW
jgi:hypothetical protein